MGFTFNDLMEQMDNGIVTYFTFRNEFMLFDDLPEVPKGYFLPIANYDLISDDICKMVINELREKNKEIDCKYSREEQESISFELTPYEADCFFIQLNLGQLFDFWHGKLPYIENKELELEYELLVDMFWDCIKEECTYEELKEYSNKFYNCYLKVSNKECD